VQVLVLYRKRSGGTTALRKVELRIAGAFLIQRLEGSRLASRRYGF